MAEDVRALIIVDVQPTFCEGGALGVKGGNAVAERIADFVTDNAGEYDLIVTTQDWHIDPGAHFSDHPDFVDSWPPHGVAGTEEAELHEAITSLPIDASVKKGEYAAAYSGFEGKDPDGTSLEDLLRDADVSYVDVVGIAESHCVKETAIDARRAGFVTRVFSDLTVPTSEELGVLARREMDEAGVDQLDSADAFGFYEEEEEVPIPGDYDYFDPSADEAGDSAESEDYDVYNDDDFDDYEEYDAAEDADTAGAPASVSEGRVEEFDDELDGLDDLGLDDFDDLDVDFDADFSAEVSEDDFDFSDIDVDPLHPKK